LTLRIDPPWSSFNKLEHTAPLLRRILTEIESLPEVVSAATVDALPLAGERNRHSPVVEGLEPERTPPINLMMVSRGYFATLRVPLIEGRLFDERDDERAAPVAIVSERLAAQLWPGQSPLGRRLRLGALDGNCRPASITYPEEPWRTVIGVVGGVRQGGVAEPKGADLYVSMEQEFVPDTFVVVRTRATPMLLARAVRDAIWRVDPLQAVFDVRTYAERVSDSLWQQRLAAVLLGAFGLVALLLSSIAAHGIVAVAAARRTSELGLRSALGATSSGIVLLLLRETLALLAAGAGLGIVLALAAGRLASSWVADLPRPSPPLLLLAAAAIGSAALLASWLPAWRASRLSPMEALRRADSG